MKRPPRDYRSSPTPPPRHQFAHVGGRSLVAGDGASVGGTTNQFVWLMAATGFVGAASGAIFVAPSLIAIGLGAGAGAGIGYLMASELGK